MRDNGRNNVFSQSQPIWVDRQFPNMYVMFRKEFDIAEEASNLQFNVFVEGRYKAFLNGQFLGYGPARYEPEYKEYDSYTIESSLLANGKNCIAVLVHYIGRDTFQYIKTAPAFIAEILWTDCRGGHRLGTDSAWRAKVAQQWLPSVKMNIQLGFSEVFDARIGHDGWKYTGYNDDGWESATEMESEGTYFPRSIPMLKEYCSITPSVVERGIVKNSPKIYFLEAGDFYDSDKADSEYVLFYTYIYSPADQYVEMGTDENKDNSFYINGKEVTGFIEASNVIGKRNAKIKLNRGWNLFAGKLAYKGFWQTCIAFDGSSPVFLLADCSEEDGGFYVTGRKLTKNTCEKILNSNWGSIAALRECGGQWRLTKACTNTAFTVAWEEVCAATHANERFPCILNHSEYVLFDFGMEVFGRVEIDLDSPEGVIIDLAYGENLVGGRVNPIKSNTWYADRYIAKQGRQTWRTFDTRGFRYLQLVIRRPIENKENIKTDGCNTGTGLPRPVVLHALKACIYTYPVEYRGEFRCSDEGLNKIWEMGRHTLHMCMEDAYIDCPWRERGQWWGDARVEFLINLAAFGDFKLMRRGLLQIGRGQQEDGLVPGVYPNRFLGTITDFSLIWVSSVWDYYRYSGDQSILAELMPRMKKVLNYFIERMDNGLTVVDPKKWTFIDWVDMEKKGKSSVVNAFFYKALIDTASAAQRLGDNVLAGKLNEISLEVKKGINCYLASENGYYDSITDRLSGKNCGVHGNALMISYNIAPKSRWPDIIKLIKEGLKKTLQDDHHYAVSGYFMHYVFEALIKAGEIDFALHYIRNWWGWYIDQGYGAINHYHNARSSLCHAWSCSPVWVLSQTILGVKFPYAADFETVRIEPYMEQFDWAKGKYPHPYGGTINVYWFKKGKIHLTIDLPGTYHVELKLPETYLIQSIFINDDKESYNEKQASGIVCLKDVNKVRLLIMENKGMYVPAQ